MDDKKATLLTVLVSKVEKEALRLEAFARTTTSGRRVSEADIVRRGIKREVPATQFKEAEKSLNRNSDDGEVTRR